MNGWLLLGGITKLEQIFVHHILSNNHDSENCKKIILIHDNNK